MNAFECFVPAQKSVSLICLQRSRHYKLPHFQYSLGEQQSLTPQKKGIMCTSH